MALEDRTLAPSWVWPLRYRGLAVSLRCKRCRIEAVSSLHAMVGRGELRRDQAGPVFDRVLSAPIRRREPHEPAREVWKVADAVQITRRWPPQACTATLSTPARIVSAFAKRKDLKSWSA
jgi:hypothetical protein